MAGTKLSLTTVGDAAAQALHIDDDLAALKALKALLENAGALIAKLNADGINVVTVEDVLAKLSVAVKPPELAAAFEHFGLEKPYEALVAWLDKAVRLEGQIPQKYKDLLKRLGDFPAAGDAGKVGWSVTTTKATPDPAPGQKGYALNLGLAAEVAFDADAAWPGANPPNRLLKIGVNGKIEAGAHASLPFAYGSASGAIGGSAALALDYYFTAADQGQLYAAAVAKRLEQLPAPFDLEAVWDRFADATTDLDGIAFTFDDAADAKFDVAISSVQALKAGVTIDAGLTVGVKASRKNNYTLTLRRESAAGPLVLLAKLTRHDVKSGQLDGDFGLKVDVSALAKPVGAIIRRVADDWKTYFEEIKPFLTPGTWLRDYTGGALKTQLGRLIKDEALKTAVLADIETALGIGAEETSKSMDWLADQVASAIDRASALVSTPVTDAVNRAVEAFKEAAPAVAALIPPDDLTGFLDEQIAAAKTGLKDKVIALFNEDKKAFNAALKAMGGQINSAVTKADDALAPVLEVLNRYDALFQKILTFSEAAAKQKVTARIYRQEVRTRESDVQVSGRLLDKAPGTAAVFATLTRGNLQELEKLVTGPPTAPGFDLIEADSKVTRISSFKSEAGVEIAFVNALLKSSVVMSGKATVTLNAQGDVEVDVEGNFQNSLWIPWNERGAFFSDSFRVVQAAAMAKTTGVPPVVELGFGAVYHEKKLSWSDVADFVTDLDKANLLPFGTLAEVKAVFDRWSAGGGKIAGDLSASVSPRGDVIKTLLCLSERTPTAKPEQSGLSEEAKLKIVTVGLNAAIGVGAIDEDEFNQGFALAKRFFKKPHEPGLTREAATLHFFDKIGNLHRPDSDNPSNTGIALNASGQGGYIDESLRLYTLFYDNALALRRLVHLIDTMGGIYQSIQGDPDQSPWTDKQYAVADEMLLKDVKTWLTVFRALNLLRGPDITSRTLAFMRAMADLSGRSASVPGGVVLTMTYNKPDGPLTASFG